MKEEAERNCAQVTGASTPNEDHVEHEIDEALIESFPASDPPFWTLGHDAHTHPHPEENTLKKAQDKSGPEKT